MKSLPGRADGQAGLPGMKEKLDGNWYLSLYELSPYDILQLRAYDSYGIHRIVYDLFEKTRTKEDSESSGIIHADLGKKRGMRQILILSNRKPFKSETGRLNTRLIPPDYLEHDAYRFSIIINPVIRNNKSGKIVAVKGREAIEQWFVAKAESHGFEIMPGSLQTNSIKVDRFKKGDANVTLGKACLEGILSVTDRRPFIRAACKGIGRGKAFGCGLLQIAPV